MDRFHFWKFLLIIGIILSLVAFVLGWISFGVPDWHTFRRYSDSIQEYYGLWAYCQEQTSGIGTVCRRWPTAEDQLFNGSRPGFVRTGEGLITTGMIFLSFGLATAIISMLLPLLASLAGVLAFIAFICLVVGLPIFGRQSNNLSNLRGDVEYHKRYGFWLMVPTIVLEFLSIFFFLAAAGLYKFFSYGNFFSRSTGKIIGGRRVASLPHTLAAPPIINAPYASSVPLFDGGGIEVFPSAPIILSDQPAPTLLSQYLAHSLSQSHVPTIIQTAGGSVLPQPSVARAIAQDPLPNVTPAYIRAEDLFNSPDQPIINMSGETIIGPIERVT